MRALKGMETWMRFLAEAGRRRVWRTAVGYAAGVFVILQLAEIVLPAFDAPEGVLRALVVLSCLGFPLVLALSWMFDLTPEGLRSASFRIAADDGPRFAGALLPRVAFLALSLAVLGGVGRWAVRDTVGSGSGATAAADLTGGMDPSQAALSEAPNPGTPPLNGATNVGATSPTPTSAPQRAATAQPASLDTAFGSGAAWDSEAPGPLRVTVQIVRESTGEALWTQSYEGTFQNPVALQAGLARIVARAMSEQLFGTLARVEAERPTLPGAVASEEPSPEAAQNPETTADPSLPQALAPGEAAVQVNPTGADPFA